MIGDAIQTHTASDAQFFRPVSFCSCRAMESKTSSVTCWMLAAISA